MLISGKSHRVNMMMRNNSESGTDLHEHVVTETWLRTVLVEYYTKEKENPRVTINSFKVTDRGESSESVLSDILALSVEADVDEVKKSFDFIVKLLPLDPFSRYFVKEAEFDLREIKFYTQLVPDLEEFQRDRLTTGCPPIELPVPSCFLAKYVPMNLSETPPATSYEINESVIVLEDLKKKGYRNVSFQKGLTLDQAESAFKAVSRLHALSLAYKVQENKPLDEKYDFLFQTEKASFSYQQLMERGLPQLINFLEKREEMTQVVECLNAIRPRTKHLIQVLLAPKEPLSLITHTDFWSNNLLFKDDRCLILDWQMVTYGRPTNDLALLLISSLPAAIRREHGTSLLDLYWGDFVRHCRNLHLDVENELNYTREDLQQDYKTSQLLALLLCIGSIDVAFRDSEIEDRLIAVLLDLREEGVLSADLIDRL